MREQTLVSHEELYTQKKTRLYYHFKIESTIEDHNWLTFLKVKQQQIEWLSEKIRSGKTNTSFLTCKNALAVAYKQVWLRWCTCKKSLNFLKNVLKNPWKGVEFYHQMFVWTLVYIWRLYESFQFSYQVR